MIFKNLKKIRNTKDISINGLGRLAGISPSYISGLERGVKTNPSQETLERIADTLEVSIDRLTGEAVSSIIESRLEGLGMDFSELAEKASVPLLFLHNLDRVIPDSGDYVLVTRIAEVLGLPPGTLRAALARQEPPVYDGSISSAEDDFSEIETIAANREDDPTHDLPQDAIDEIERFKEFVKHKYKK